MRLTTECLDHQPLSHLHSPKSSYSSPISVHLVLSRSRSLFLSLCLSLSTVSSSSLGNFTLPSRVGRDLPRPAISPSCLCKTEGIRSHVVTEPAFLVHWRRRSYAQRVDLFRIICMLRMFLYILWIQETRMQGYKRD